MPIYEYVCNDCDTKFEKIRPVSLATEPAPCPLCSKDAERILSRFACFSTGEDGIMAPVGGDGCSSCGSSDCSSCNM